MSEVVLELLNTKPIEKHALILHIIKALTANPHYPDPKPSLAVLQAAADELKQSMLDVAHAKAALKTAVDKQRKSANKVAALLQQESWYVESASGGDKAKIITSGMKARREKTNMQIPPKVEFFRGKANDFPGQIVLRWKRMLKSLNIQYYQVRYTFDQLGEGTAHWLPYEDSTTKSKMIFISPQPGVKVWMQVRARNSAGFGEWSNPIAVISHVED